MKKKLGVLWLRFLREIKEDLKEVPKEFLEDTEIAKAVEITRTSSYTKEQLEGYDGFLDAVRVQNTVIVDALKQGKAEGLKEGKEEGLKKGLEKGKEEGLKEAKIETAKQMLRDGLSIEMIQKYTRLSVEEITLITKNQ